MSKYGVFSGPYFPVFGLYTEIYSVNLRIHSKYRKIRTRKNSVFGHFSRSVDVFKGTDVNKTSSSEDCDVCHYWYFLSFSFKFQANVCNRCHGLLMMSVNLSDIIILNIKDSDYRCIISLISKNEAINLMKNADLTEKIELL